MYRIISRLLIYGDMPADSILMQLGDIFRRLEDHSQTREELRTRVFTQIKRLLKLATDYGFDENLWQNYLTYLLITDENPFSLTCEKVGAGDGSVNHFALGDFQAFIDLFHFDFSGIESELDVDCFSLITHYRAIVKKERMYNKNVSDKVRSLSRSLACAAGADDFFRLVTGFYRDYGVGMFGLNKAFRIASKGEEEVSIFPINNMDSVTLDDLIGYEHQKKQLIDNTLAFVEGRSANNALLYGDAGTGKSTSIKAIVNEFYDQGLRMIEIYKHQFKDLSNVIARNKNRGYRFIIYMDDLSFEEFEIEYKFLKAVIEGGVETRPDNILIYATSNRRHLIRETWDDRNDMEHGGDIHRSDTLEEKLSLASRFGCSICYLKPSRQEFDKMVVQLARRRGLDISRDELLKEANRWEIRHGGISGRTAAQFINYLAGNPHLIRQTALKESASE